MPEAYTPQFIALGPYHHWRQDLYEMERYKLICAKKVQKEFKSGLTFEDLVKRLLKKEHEVRGCYHKYLDMDGEALAWMMTIDGLFLLEFLHIYANLSHKDSLASSARMSFLVNSMGKKLAYDAILKDILMLENQIPTFVLKKILRIQCPSRDLADNMLHPIMMGVCRELSPFKLNEDHPLSDATQCMHLLDLLYHLIVPKLELDDNEEDLREAFLSKEQEEEEETSLGKDDKDILNDTWQMASKLTVMKKFANKYTKLIDCKPLKILMKMPMKVVSKIPIVSAIIPALESMLLGTDKEGSNRDTGGKDPQVPLVEEIMVPSIVDLSNAGIEFCPTDGDVSTIKFDSMARKFHLPVIYLDQNTEVIMRNLVAYEASAISGPLVLGRYTELMNGIIDTPEDAAILRKKRIIISCLKSDKDVAELWNGMTKTIRLTKVPFIDKATEEANRYYNNTLKRKCHKLMKAYVYGSWRILIVLATLLMLGLMVLQSFCSVYSCPRLFHLTDTNE